MSRHWEQKRLESVRRSMADGEAARLAWKHRKDPKGDKAKLRQSLRAWQAQNRTLARILSIANLPKDVAGANNGNWKGGITSEERRFRSSGQYRRWRRAVLTRHHFTCATCLGQNHLEVHHIVPMAALRSAALLEMNGVSLCRQCHSETESYGSVRRQEMLGELSVMVMTIPHTWQAYATCGNWAFTSDGTLLIFVSKTGNWRYDMAVAFHEMMEALLCKAHGVSQAKVDGFDMGPIGKLLEDPGDDPRAPYYREHTAGYIAEYAFLAGCGVAVDRYRDALGRLYDNT